MLDKQKMAANFNSAAQSYESVSSLQTYVGAELLDRLQVINLLPGRVLDLGAGPGRFSRELARKYPRAQIFQLDIAKQMLELSRLRDKRFFSRQHYICADAEKIPLSDGVVEMVFSNLMLQWCPQPDEHFKEIARVLKREGLFIFSSFGPDTLRELRESWAVVDENPHVHTFIDMHDLGDALVRSGFADPVIEVDNITLTYPDVKKLMRGLKDLGADNINRDRRKTLTGKHRFLRMLQEYEKKRINDNFPATYEIIFGHAWAQNALKQRSVEGTYEISVDNLKESLKRFHE